MSQQVLASNPMQDPMQDPLDDSKMTLMEHLIELRLRLMWIMGALIVGTLIALVYYTQLFFFITETARSYKIELQFLSPFDNISIIFKVCFTIGTAFAMPLILYHIIAFMSPGLYPHEKRGILLTLPGVIFLFLLGAAFAYWLLLPVAVGFFASLFTGIIAQQWAADRYIGFVTRLVFWIGIAFETPLIIALLARMGLVSGSALLGFWRQAIVVMAIISAAITPTVDPVNMALVMGPLIILYFLGVGLAYLLYRPRVARDFTDEPFSQE